MTYEHPYFTIPFTESQQYKPNYLLQAKPQEIIDYLIASHRRFEYQFIPQIEQIFLGLIKIYPNSRSLNTIFKLFIKFQLDLQIHAKLEEQKLYVEFLNPTGKYVTSDFTHEEEEPFLTEIITLLEKQSLFKNPFYGILLTHLCNFERELKEHAWLEENLVISKMK